MRFSSPDHFQGFDPIVGFRSGNAESAIDLSCASLRKRRLAVSMPGFGVDAVEHILPIRFLYPGLRIEFPDHAPYVSNAGLILNALRPYSKQVEVDVPWFTVEQARQWVYPKPRNGMRAFTRIEPNETANLDIRVTVSFRSLGTLSERFIFPNHASMEKVLHAPAPGNPSWLKIPARWLWPSHFKSVFWPDVRKPEESLRNILFHRVQDILGAIALLSPSSPAGFPSLTVISECSGHRADFEALRAIRTKPLD